MDKIYYALVYGKNKPTFNINICKKCGGLGIYHIMCCSGIDCGCLGLPADFKDCNCGVLIPTNEQILEWT